MGGSLCGPLVAFEPAARLTLVFWVSAANFWVKEELQVKVRFSRHQGATAQQPKPKRAHRAAGPRALGRERPARLYSLLLPPSYPKRPPLAAAHINMRRKRR